MGVDVYKELYNKNFLSQYKSQLFENLKENDPAQEFNINNDLALEVMIITLTEILEEANSQLSGPINEGVGSVMRKASDAMSKAAVKVTLADRQLSERINDKFNRYLKLYRESKRNAAYDTVVKRAIDLSRILKNVIMSSIVGLLVPGTAAVKLVSAIIAILVKTAIDKRTDAKYKNLIFNDLKLELKIVQEKIKDADARGDIKAKYKLMRIENELGRAMNRIQFNLRD